MQLRWRQLACRCRRHMLAPIYLVYEHRLLRHVRAFPVPRHIGLILDGNRRFGRQFTITGSSNTHRRRWLRDTECFLPQPRGIDAWPISNLQPACPLASIASLLERRQL
jgi:hypothetical protein